VDYMDCDKYASLGFVAPLGYEALTVSIRKWNDALEEFTPCGSPGGDDGLQLFELRVCSPACSSTDLRADETLQMVKRKPPGASS